MPQAAGVEQIDRGAGGLEELDLVFHGHERLLMTMPVDDDAAAGERWGSPAVGGTAEHLAEHDGLLAEELGAFVAGKEVDELVAEDAGAARLEHDDGDAGSNLGLELVKDIEQITAGLVEEAEVVEWTAAAYVFARDFHPVAGGS